MEMGGFSLVVKFHQGGFATNGPISPSCYIVSLNPGIQMAKLKLMFWFGTQNMIEKYENVFTDLAFLTNYYEKR